MELLAPNGRNPFVEAVGDRDRDAIADNLFSEKFLIKRPLLQALEPCQDGPPILLIDELDRTDEPFEAYLLEVLSDFSDYHSRNRHDCRRRTAARHHHIKQNPGDTRRIKAPLLLLLIDYPDAERELAILEVKAPSAPVDLSRQVVAFVQKLRDGLIQATGVAETIDWAHALTQLDCMVLDPDTINNTLEHFSNIRTILKRFAGVSVSRILTDIKGEMLIAGTA